MHAGSQRKTLLRIKPLDLAVASAPRCDRSQAYLRLWWFHRSRRYGARLGHALAARCFDQFGQRRLPAAARIGGELPAHAGEHGARGCSRGLLVAQVPSDRLARRHAFVPSSKSGQARRVRKTFFLRASVPARSHRFLFDCATTLPAKVLVTGEDLRLSSAREALSSVLAPVCAGLPAWRSAEPARVF
jgi:hypothetical protein